MQSNLIGTLGLFNQAIKQAAAHRIQVIDISTTQYVEVRVK